MTENMSFALILQQGASLSFDQMVRFTLAFLQTFFTEFGPRQFFTVGSLLFCIGLYGVLVRRNAIALLMSTELMLNGVNVLFVMFNRYWGVKVTRAAFTSAEQVMSPIGQIFAIFIIIIAAAEAAVGLAIIIAMYRVHKSVNVEDFNLMKW
jgi:NADH:ubiquinone oxidoreductase subunit K